MNLREKYPPLRNLIDLAGKTAIVTGGAMGIGLAISYRLAEAGAGICIADINADAARQTSRELQGCGYRSSFIPCDVTREEQVRDMVSAAVREMGGIDILVNNAGIYPCKPLAEMTGDDFDRVIAVNLKGAFLCSLEVSRQMINRQQGGDIINIASIEALHPSSSGLSAYDASKGGLLTLTRSLARELGPHDIRVNAVAPGGILTQGVASRLQPAAGGKAELKAFMARMALGRMGNADDVARVVLFLASDLASYMTGSLVVVDGGYLIS